VVGNLMSNALNHTPDGTPIEVHVRSGTLHGWGAATVSGPADQLIPAVIFEVVDHGPGMSADQAQRVFERFYRADAARNRATGGTGLGLAIVSALVSAHGGTVFLDTAPGRGATFRVTLPLAPEARGDGAEEPEGPLDEEQQVQTWQPGQAQAGQPGGPAQFMAQSAPAPPSAEPSAAPEENGSPAAGESTWPTADRPGASGQQPDVIERRPWRPFS
jgi:Histidine kinase-, DNA gyrase B-, and HSP90-like ATPase